MGWSLNQVQPSGTSGAQGVSGADGSQIIIYSDGSDLPPQASAIGENSIESYRRLFINRDSYRLYSLEGGIALTTNNLTDHGKFAGSDGSGYDGIVDNGDGTLTFSGTGDNTDFTTTDLRGTDGTDGSDGSTPLYLTGSGAPIDADPSADPVVAGTGTDGDVYIDTSTGDFYGPRTSGVWGISTLNLKGQDGIDVQTASATTGDLIITLSDATEVNAGSVSGADGSTPTFSIGSVTTGSAGSDAIVTIDESSTPLNQVLNFVIPQGSAGADGQDGEDGQTITQTAEVSTETGALGDLSSINGNLYQKRLVDHVSRINVSLADFTADDTTLDPNGDYEFTNFTTDSQGNEYARYILERNDGGSSPDYIIEFDELEGEWELKANVTPTPSPLLQCKPAPIQDGINCNFYPIESNWQKNSTNYPLSTTGVISQTETTGDYIEYKQSPAYLQGSDTNQSQKVSIEIPQAVGYVKGVPYYGAFHTMESGQKMTGASHSDTSEYIYDTTSLDWKANQLLLTTNKDCEILVYAKTGTGIVVTDDEASGIGSTFLGLYTLEGDSHNSKDAWRNENNKYISWDGAEWAFRDSVNGTGIRSISTQDIDDPSDLTQQEANLINIYPERRTLTFNAFTQGSEDQSHTNTGVSPDDVISIGGQVTQIPLYLDDLTPVSDYPTIYIQLLTRERDIELVTEVVKFAPSKQCWENLTTQSDSIYTTLGSLDNVHPLVDEPSIDKSMIVWSVQDQRWVLSANYSTSWSSGNSDPLDSFGSEGDYHINNQTKDIFKKVSNVWVQQFNTASGADGIGIESVEENDGSVEGKPQYSLTFTFTDDSTFTTSALNGETGANGSAGGLPTGGSGGTTGTGAGVTAWTPTETKSDGLWIDASKTASISKQGDNVASWVDAYLQGNSMVAVASNEPVVSLYSGLDPLFDAIDVVSVNDVTAEMNSNVSISTISLASNFYLAGLFELRAVADGIVVDQGNGNSTGSISVKIESGDLKLSTTDSLNATTSTTLDASVSLGNIYNVLINARANDYSIHVNGAEIAVVNKDIRKSLNNKKFTIGDPSGSASALSRHCEWIIGTEHLTDLSILNLQGYLAHKWGSVEDLPSDHENKTISPELTGGSQGQLLSKIGDGDYEVAWVDPTPYNKFIKTGTGIDFDILPSHHGASIIIDNAISDIDVILPYNPPNGWQVFMISRNHTYPVRILAYDSGGGTQTIIPDAGWGQTGDVSTTCFLKDQGDSCSATWDKEEGKWYVQGNLRTYREAYDLDGLAINGDNNY